MATDVLAGDPSGAPGRPRARGLGVRIGGLPSGRWNAITDVAGVRVGHVTLIDGDAVRTGVTVIVPADEVGRALVFAGCHRLNGNGEMTGLEWVRESGMLTTPVALTNTHSVGVVRDALVAADVARRPAGESFWSLPVVGETWDGVLNDTNGFHVRPEHLVQALWTAATGPVPEGSVGGGTGMVCHELKGGIGTSSRLVAGGFTVGVLVQANYGVRERLTVAGVPVGREIPAGEVPPPRPGSPQPPGSGSIIAVVATDAPCLPHQCARLAQRAGLGLARVGGVGGHTSGDIFLAFATGNAATLLEEGPEAEGGPLTRPVTMLSDMAATALYEGVVDATEEAIVNALVAAGTMTGRDGVTVHALPHARLVEVLRAYNRYEP